MKSIIKNYRFVICMVWVAFLTGCNAEQEWDVDKSLDGLFRPLTFETSKVYEGAVEIRYNRVINAAKYIFEFSEGDEEGAFNNVTKTVEILADTLKPYAVNSIQTKTEFRTLFKGLFGETVYSVRMKAVNADGSLVSKYTTPLIFNTLAEQLFRESAIVKGLTAITLKWEQTEDVTHIVMHPLNAEDDSNDIVRTLSSTDIAAAEAGFEELSEGTDYQFTLYNNTVKRGKVTVRTLGLPNSGTYMVQPEDNAASISAQLNVFINDRTRNIVLCFQGGTSYSVEKLTLPDGIDNISFTGVADGAGNLPEVTLNSLKLGSASASLIEVSFENMHINGNAANFCAEVPNAIASLKSIRFNDCTINNFGRGVVSVSNVGVMMDGITIRNSIVSKIGGYGIVNIAGSNAKVTNITFQYCTLIDLTTHFTDFRTDASLNILSCTIFNNTTSQLDRILRCNDSAPFPMSVNILKSIFAGANNNKKMGLTYKSGTNSTLLPVMSFAGSYSTFEFPLEFTLASYPNMETLTITSGELFTDPDNGDFSIKDGVVFAGKDVAGDPRWFSK